MEYMESQMQNQIEAAMEQEDDEPFVQVLIPVKPNASLETHENQNGGQP